MNEKEIKLVSEKLEVDKNFFDKWSNKIQVKKYKIGEIILNTNVLPQAIFLLIEGKIRLRGISKNEKSKIFSLGILNPFEIVGLASNRLKTPIEIVSAGSDCTFLYIKLEDWNLFKEQINKETLKIKEEKIDLSELCITSFATVNESKNDEITVETKKADGEKCPVCWKVSTSPCTRHNK